MGMGEKSWRRKEIRRVLFLLRRVRDRWLWNVRRGESRGSIYRLIFINYINSPRRGQPVDWVTRIIRSSPVSLSPLPRSKDRSVLFLPLSLSHHLKNPSNANKRGEGKVESFYGIVKNVKYGVSAVSRSLEAA